MLHVLFRTSTGGGGAIKSVLLWERIKLSSFFAATSHFANAKGLAAAGRKMWKCPCLMMAAMTAVIVGLFPLGTDAAGPTVVAIDYRWSAQKCTTFRENFYNVSEKCTTFRENFTTFQKNLQRVAKVLQHFRKIYNVSRKILQHFRKIYNISRIATWLYSKKKLCARFHESFVIVCLQNVLKCSTFSKKIHVY